MKRFLIGLVIALTAIFNVMPVYADVNDFTIRDFHADYYLGRDSENRSTLKTVEEITAEFPNYDQNHGIERAIPKTYDGHNVSLSVLSVTDENLRNINYEIIDDDNGNSVIRIGDSDTYVRGEKKYVITYNQRDVTKYFSDTKDDEFYWDVNGNSWSQNFNQVSATIYIDENIVGEINNNLSCYYGSYGSNNKCQISNESGEISASVDNLGPNQTMTVAIGFKAKTFAEYQKTEAEKIADLCAEIYVILTILALITSIALTIYVIVLRVKYGGGAKSTHAIVPEYMPPENVDILTSATVQNNIRNWVAAEYINLAINGKIRIIEKTGGIFNKASYSVELISTKDLTEYEDRILRALFNDNLEIGSKHNFKKNSPEYSLYKKIKAVYDMAGKDAEKDGYYEDIKPIKKKITKVIVILSILLLFMGISFIPIFIVGIISATMKPLSQKGRDLVDYLDGLKMYIKTAEEDRIKYLQSPKGAEKIAIDTSDNEAMVKLYEKLLPYAVMFGCEKEWSKVLGQYYEIQSQNPDWYSGNGVFNAIVFSSAISSFSSSAISNSYSAPTSSSSGGSGGGGFSGGGGGGGGGGGW